MHSNEEEAGGNDRGSAAFADSLYFRGDTVLGMLNIDMIGYHTALNTRAALMTDTNSYSLYNIFDACTTSLIIQDLHFILSGMPI